MLKFLATTLILACLYSINTSAQSLSAKADQLLSEYNRKGQFDGSVLIAKGDQVIYQQQIGWANRQFKVPVTADTKFPVASITKWYAAILVMALREEGKLQLDRPVADYIPGLLPKNNTKISLQHLLSHTSGLPNEKVADYLAPSRPPQFIKNRIVDTVLFVPGTKYRYNNVNYILIAAIIEQVTGHPWENVLQEKIIQRLKLSRTGIIKRDSVINELAYGYHNYAFGNPKVKDPLENDEPLYLENYALAGALFTTPAELFAVHQALRHKALLRQSSLKLLYDEVKEGALPDQRGWKVTPAGYVGQQVIGGRTVEMIERNGNINGYNATFLQLPATDHTLIIFTNTDAGDLGIITKELVKIITAQ